MTKKTAGNFLAAFLIVSALSACSVGLDTATPADRASAEVSVEIAAPFVLNPFPPSTGGRAAGGETYVYLQTGASSDAKLYGPLSAKSDSLFSSTGIPSGTYPELYVIRASRAKPDMSPIVVSKGSPTFAWALETCADAAWSRDASLSFGVLSNVVVEGGKALTLNATLIPLADEAADLGASGGSLALPPSATSPGVRVIRLSRIGAALDPWLLVSRLECTVRNLSSDLSGNVSRLVLLTARGEVVGTANPDSSPLAPGQSAVLVADYPADNPGELFLCVEYRGSELALSFDLATIDGRSARFDYYVGPGESSGSGASASDPMSLDAAFAAIETNQTITASRPARIILTGDLSLSPSRGYSVTKPVKIVSVGEPAHTIALARGLPFAFFSVGDSASGTRGDLTLENARISGGGKANPSGGPLVAVSLGSFTMASGSELSDNVFAAGSGGAVALLGTGARMTMNSGAIRGCAAAGSGAIDAGAGELTLSGGAIYACEALTGSGGAISLSGGSLKMIGGSISDCRAQDSGGAIVASAGIVSVGGGSIAGCSALSGGAIFASDGASVIVDGTGSIGRSGKPNKAVSPDSGGGGGIAIARKATLTLASGSVSNNEAQAAGGGIYVGPESSCVVSGGSVSSNLASLQGGGVYVAGSLSVRSTGNAWAVIGGDSLSGGNRALQGGGAYVAPGGSLAIGANARVHRNQAGSIGGGVYVSSGGTIDHSLAGDDAVSFNQAPRMAGGVFLAEQAIRIGPANWGASIASNLTLVNGVSIAVLPDLARRVSVATESALANALSDGSEPRYIALATSISYPGTLTVDRDLALGADGANAVLSSSNRDAPLVAIRGGRLSLCDSIVLSGGNSPIGRSRPLVEVTEGSLVIRDDASLVKGVNLDAAVPGGALYLDGGTVTMLGGSIGGSSPGSGNAGPAGGGVYVAKGDFTMYGGSIRFNRVSVPRAEGGAGIYSKAGVLTFLGGAVSDNDARDARAPGGGVFASGGIVSFPADSSARVSGNAARSGGGIYLAGNASLRMKGGAIGGENPADGNLATENGGGVFAETARGSIALDGGSVSGNLASGSGGGMYLAGSGQSLALGGNVAIRANRAERSGGGLYFAGDSVGDCSIAESVSISGNHVSKDYGLSCGAGVFIDSLPSVYAEFIDAQTSLSGNTDATSIFVVNITKVP